MKKIFYLLVTIILFSSCNNSEVDNSSIKEIKIRLKPGYKFEKIDINPGPDPMYYYISSEVTDTSYIPKKTEVSIFAYEKGELRVIFIEN